nr:glycoside hydrolase family 36 protein [Kineosporia babensis]
MRRFTFGDSALELVFEHGPGVAVRLVRAGGADVYPVAVVEIVTAAQGRLPASSRLAHTQLGTELRYTGHEIQQRGGVRTLVVRQAGGGLEADLLLTQPAGMAAATARVVVRAAGGGRVVLRSVASWSGGFTAASVQAPATDAVVAQVPTAASAPLPEADKREAGDPLVGWELVSGVSDWLAEGRFTSRPLRELGLPQLAAALTHQPPRGSYTATSQGTWSTGHHLPVGAVVHAAQQQALAWQIEHNGAWRWEIGDDETGAVLTLAGPTDEDAAWTKVLQPGEEFSTVPVTLAWGKNFTAAMAGLTDHRRAGRRPHQDNALMPVVFNDYMNTLNGDPTTERLLPLIQAAAEVGAEVFCIDAGWYDDTGHWWDSVGEWQPSRTRFPNGLQEVIEAVRAHGLVPGLWLEPEVIGINSPMAEKLPREAFLQRNQERVVEHHRYHLDLRHPAAVEHLNGVVDRLVEEFGIGFFKLDYNINPGPGTDLDADSPGAGLLEHNRAHLAWLDAVLERHPRLILENCSSGAMRSDWAILSRLALQSTSDQQDFRLFPPIAAAAPMTMLPEQAANWAYPQPGMTPEQISFCLVTGLLGRFYLSGYLNRMTSAERERVAAAVAVAKEIRSFVRTGHPIWPLHLPIWDGSWVALGLCRADEDLVSLWRRGRQSEVQLHLPHRAQQQITVETVFPKDLPPWSTHWDADRAVLTVRADSTHDVAARTFRLHVSDPND